MAETRNQYATKPSPRKVLYAELIGQRSKGGQNKRFKDLIKAWLKKCSVPFSQLEALAVDRDSWKSIYESSLANFTVVQDQAAEDRRTRRRATSNRTVSGSGVLPARECVPQTLIGLWSHPHSHSPSTAVA